MTTYSRILVGVDGSNEAEAAFRRAAKMAASDGAVLGIAFVADIRRIVPLIDYEQTFIHKARSYGEELVGIYENEAKKAGVRDIETFIQFGTPKSTFVKKILADFQADLVLVGATGLSSTERMLLGSVTEYVAQNAPCDVIVVRSEAWNQKKKTL
ncbi:universal stress protein [Listeria aquatica]|uniref:universal stress protein n=1 Tax=Listeria aquatica TaxID=1494960 RepID=UPI003F72E0C8